MDDYDVGPAYRERNGGKIVHGIVDVVFAQKWTQEETIGGKQEVIAVRRRFHYDFPSQNIGPGIDDDLLCEDCRQLLGD
jgi:hypothetical protein